MVEGWQRIGLIVNPLAGKSVELTLEAARNALCTLGAGEVLTGAGEVGQAALSGWRGRIMVHDVGVAASRDQTRALAQWIVEEGVDVVVVVGGDGTLADTGQVLIDQRCRTPIIGIGAGSTNVGRLITCRASEVLQLDPAKLEAWNVGCLTAHVSGDLLGRGFNDVVIGRTVVGTIDGQLRDLDAAERSRGKLIGATPRSIATPETKVTRNAKGSETVIAHGELVGTVVAGFAERAFFGKAVCGGICLAALTGLPAGCLVSSLPLVQVELSAAKLADAAPIVSSYVTLDEEVSVVVEKVQEGAILCVDGNPVRKLSPSDRVFISVNREAVRGVRFLKDQRSA